MASSNSDRPVSHLKLRNCSNVRQVTALGRLEPAAEVKSVPAALSNDRVAKLLVQRGDRVEAGQVIAIMDSRDRLQNALLEAQAQAKVSQSWQR